MLENRAKPIDAAIEYARLERHIFVRGIRRHQAMARRSWRHVAWRGSGSAGLSAAGSQENLLLRSQFGGRHAEKRHK